LAHEDSGEAIAGAEPAVEVLLVFGNRPPGYSEAAADGIGGEPVAEQAENLQLPAGELRLIRAGG
jgi:hypothetical protein